MFGLDMMGFRTRIVLGVLAVVLFADKIKGQTHLAPAGDGPTGTSSGSSNDWPYFIGNISSAIGTDKCVECVLCSDCFSFCGDLNITSGLEDDGDEINCPTDHYVQNTDNYWNCACDPSNQVKVSSQIMSRAATCAFPNAGIEAVSTFSSFCSSIGSATATSANVFQTVTDQSSTAASPIAAASRGTGEGSAVSPTTSPSNTDTGLSSTTSSATPISSSKTGLGTGAKVGIAVGSVVGALLILVALWMILGSRGKGRSKESQAEEPVTPNEDSAKPEAVQESKSAPPPARVEEFNPYPGPSDST